MTLLLLGLAACDGGAKIALDDTAAYSDTDGDADTDTDTDSDTDTDVERTPFTFVLSDDTDASAVQVQWLSRRGSPCVPLR
jgi:hypothetical protein